MNGAADMKNKKNRKPYLVSIVSEKGGVGKTTVAVNVACQLSLLGYKTLIVDADTINPSILYYFKIDKIKHSFVDVMKNKAKVKDAIIPNEVKNLDVLPGLSGYEPVAPTAAEIKKVFKSYIKLKGLYDFVIVDTPPGYFPREVYNTYNDIFVVFTPSISSCVAAARLYRVCQSKRIRVGLIGNMIKTGKEPNVAEMMNTYGTDVLNLIPQMPDVERALQVHTPLCVFDKDSKFSVATKELARKIVARSKMRLQPGRQLWGEA